MFPFEKIYAATVFNNTDPLLEGRVQIYIDLFMSGYSESLLPWARPFFNDMGGSDEFGESNIPEEETKVWVWFENDEDKKNPFYITGLQLKGLNPHRLFTTQVLPQITQITTPLTTIYPDTKYKYFPNGMCSFVSTGLTSKEAGFFHSPSSYYVIDSGGNHNILAPLTTFYGLVVMPTGPLTVASVTSPTTLSLTGGNNPSVPPQPAVLGTSLITDLTALIAACTSLSAACTALVASCNAMTPVTGSNPASVAAAATATAAVSAASASIATASSGLATLLSTNVVNN